MQPLAEAKDSREGQLFRPLNEVHLIYRTKRYESQAKDFEFSHLSMQDHWKAGYADMNQTLRDRAGSGAARSGTMSAYST
jgi:NTE family protein